MSDAVLVVTDLHVQYRVNGRTVPAVRGLDLRIAPGEVVAMVGESGSGKSTAAHAVLGLLPGSGLRTRGRIEIDGVDVTEWSDRLLATVRGSRVGLVPQDPTVSLNPVVRVGAQVAEVLRLHGLADRRSAPERAVSILREVGIDDAPLRARQYPHELSGGLRQRVLIGIALACRPPLLIADEPTSALDVTVQRRVLDHLDVLTNRFGTASLLITHDLGVAADRAHRVLVMRHGRVVEQGPTETVLRSPSHDYTRELLAAVPGRRRVAPDGRRAAAKGRDSAAAPPIREAPLAVVEDVRKAFRVRLASGAHRLVEAVRGVSLSVGRRETLALVGESGSGKSTTARLLLRLTDVTSGTIRFDGRDITRLRGSDLRSLRSRAQLVYQNPYSSLNPRLTIEQVVAEPLVAFRRGDRRSRAARVAELLDQVALPAGTGDRRPGELSGGQRQRVAIARALALRPELLVLDEPVSALDVSVQARILDLLADLQQQLALSCVFISHDLAVVRQVSDRVAVMRGGELVELGERDEVFDRPRHPYTRELLASVAGGGLVAAESLGAAATHPPESDQRTAAGSLPP
ncbi:dipeptide ABC transporter ATP-binding protein [Actinoalloteichus hymeniacidonis]|uniref:ABC transporter family protein n=1 Tax=Actinoalloteichus hymeniacidonis TaxID=340345 RepID=A0AAC9HQB8_9PSEU|nr:ABC transporter ATP-binding protein [Actinoalloteichus hymeniacidonis]AOS63368.1 ABC transporter family protein [Actinoalloteichus hymeniacidonis]MBB5908592.1 peptide/nickel transport system ATP-binding protein [Actinoalloteichus hymeniacidonis]